MVRGAAGQARGASSPAGGGGGSRSLRCPPPPPPPFKLPCPSSLCTLFCCAEAAPQQRRSEKRKQDSCDGWRRGRISPTGLHTCRLCAGQHTDSVPAAPRSLPITCPRPAPEHPSCVPSDVEYCGDQTRPADNSRLPLQILSPTLGMLASRILVRGQRWRPSAGTLYALCSTEPCRAQPRPPASCTKPDEGLTGGVGRWGA